MTFSISFDLSLGNAYSLEQDIFIKMKDSENINFTAKPKTNGFKNPLYYSLRLRERINNLDLEVELIHHKLYVTEYLPDAIEKFEISDGYNLLLMNYRKKINRLIGYRVGFGAVIAHPYIIIDGETNYTRGGGLIPKFWSDGYYWCGYSVQGSLFFERKISTKVYSNLEIKAAYSSATIPVEGGSFEMPNASVHLLLGLGYKNY